MNFTSKKLESNFENSLSKIQRAIIIKLCVSVVLIISLLFGASYCAYKQIKDAGGISQTIINIGKDIKHISKEIKKD
jgi:hypothetical protein